MLSLLTRLKAAASCVFGGYHMTEWSPDRQWRTRRSGSARHDIPYGVRRLMLDWSREMERRDPLFNRFLDLCEQYVVGPTGLRIQSASTDREYARRANAEWDIWQQFADVSTRFSFGQRQGLIEREIEVAGEVFIFLTFGSTGRPRIQLIESESVETPPELMRDESVFDGVRMEGNGRPISYFVTTKSERGFDEIEAERMVHMFDPSRVGQGRGLPIVYPVMEGLIDRWELQGYEMAAAKDHSRISRVLKTASGQVSAADMARSKLANSTQQADGTATTQSIYEYYQKVYGAEAHVIRNGDEMQFTQSNRPSVAVQSFWDSVDARNAAGLGLPIEIMIMRSLQGTMARGAFDMANGFFRSRSASRAEGFARIWEWVTGSSTALRRIQPLDWRRIKYAPPKAINVDVGRNSSALIAEWQQGWWTLDDIVGPYGKTAEEVLEQRALDFKLAREIEAKHGLTPGAIFPTTTQEQPKQETNDA
jgi:capsid protein